MRSATIKSLAFCIIGFSITVNLTFGQGAELQTIKSVVASQDDFVYVEKLDQLINGERWGFHSGAIGIPTATSTLEAQAANNYSITNIHDLDLTTAWIEGKRNYGIGESFTIEFSFKEDYEGFGKVHNFYGVIELFNGYCKSEEHWIENSRIKTLKMYFNEKPVCLIELLDTWQYQRLDLRRFFKEPVNFPDAPFKVTDGDKLRFEVMEVYKGSKYSDTGISEFVFESPGN